MLSPSSTQHSSTVFIRQDVSDNMVTTTVLVPRGGKEREGDGRKRSRDGETVSCEDIGETKNTSTSVLWRIISLQIKISSHLRKIWKLHSFS